VVSVLDSGAEGPGFKSQSRRCRVTVLGKLFTPIVHQAAKLVAAFLRVAGVTAGLAESNGSLPPGLWLMSPAGCLPRTVISSGTLRSIIEYGLPLPFYCQRIIKACSVSRRQRNWTKLHAASGGRFGGAWNSWRFTLDYEINLPRCSLFQLGCCLYSVINCYKGLFTALELNWTEMFWIRLFQGEFMARIDWAPQRRGNLVGRCPPNYNIG